MKNLMGLHGKNSKYKDIPYILNDDINKYTIIDHLTIASFYMHALNCQNIVFAVANTEKYTSYIPSLKIDHKVRAGDPIVVGSLVDQAIKNKKRVSVKMSKELYGFPFIGTAYPVFDNNNVIIGGLVVAEPIDDLEKVNEVTNSLSEVSENILNASIILCFFVRSQS